MRRPLLPAALLLCILVRWSAVPPPSPAQGFAAPEIATDTDGAISAVARDVDGNHRPNVLFTSQNDDIVAWYKNEGEPAAAPVARADTFATDEDRTLTVDAPGVLANDSDPDGDRLRANLVSGPSRGSVTLEEDGSFSYTPAADSNGTDAFTYATSDGDSTDPATVVVTVRPVNDAPSITLAGNLSVTNPALGGRPQTIPHFAIDFDPGPDESSQSIRNFIVREQSDSNQVVRDVDVSNDGTLRYTPAQDAHGTATIGVQVRDDGGTGNGGTDTSRTQTFDLVVDTRTNAAPVARADTFATDEDRTLTVDPPGVLANDSDPDGDRLRANLVSGPSRGSVTLEEDGSFSYTPAADSNGTDTFTYATSDGDTTDPATVVITVRPINDAPSVSVVTPDAGTTLPVRQSARIEAEASDVDGDVTQVAFFVDGATAGIDEDESDGFATSWTPQMPRQHTLTAEATDDTGAMTRSDTITVTVRNLTLQTSVTRTFPDPDAQRSFRLVALPGQSRIQLRETVSGTPPEDWRAFRESGRTETRSFRRDECTPTTQCTFAPGTGFWLIARQSWSLNREMDAVPLRSDTSGNGLVYRVDLHEGWNIVSNPLETDVPWRTVQEASGTNQRLWRWIGRWQQASTLESATSGEAYYFMDDQIDELVIPFPSASSSQANTGPADSKQSRRAFVLRAVKDRQPVSAVRVGLRRGTQTELDASDRYGPPGYFGATTLRLVHREDSRRYELSTEFRPPGQNGHAFDLELNTEPGTSVTLRTAGVRKAFANRQVRLVQHPTGRSFDLRTDSTVTVRPDAKTTAFRLLVGSETYVDDAGRDVHPERATLLPIYPNPFRGVATIEYSLPEPQSIRLAVYDVLGRRVAVLEDGRKTTGFHRMQWRGRDATGRPVASGMYLIRLETGTAVTTQRVMLLR